MAVDNPWLRRRVLAFGHRGSARLWPENTMRAFRGAVAAGAPALEMDLRVSADGHVVVCHDATVDRTTDGSGPVAAYPLVELACLDAAHRFVPGHGAEDRAPDGPYPLRGTGEDDLRIPALSEVLAAFPGTLLTMELKDADPLAPALAAALRALLAEHGRDDDVIVSAYDDAVLRAFRRLAPTVPTAASAAETAAFLGGHGLRAVAPGTRPPVAFQVPITHRDVEVVTPAFVRDAHAGGLAVHVWTVDDPERISWLLDLGVDGIMSDRPDVVVSQLEARALAWTSGPIRHQPR